MPKKQGVCLNVGGCSKAKNRELQEAEISAFVCEECGKPLREKAGKPTKSTGPNKKLVIGIASAVALAALGTGGYFIFSGRGDDNTPPPPPPPPSVVHVSVSEFISMPPSTEQVYEMEGVVSGFKDTAAAFVLTDATGKVTVSRIAAIDEVIKQLNDKDTLTIRGFRADENANPVVAAPAEYVSHRDYKSVTPPRQPVNPEYGTYDGPRNSAGKPHGVGGEVKVTKAYSLDMKDGNRTVVELNPGDRIVNTKFSDGKLVQGQLKRPDGTQKYLSIGN